MIRLNLLILIILLGCTQQSDTDLADNNNVDAEPQQVSISPKIFTIKPDSLKTFISGKKGFPKPIINSSS